jgi:hypothetical protein
MQAWAGRLDSLRATDEAVPLCRAAMSSISNATPVCVIIFDQDKSLPIS